MNLTQRAQALEKKVTDLLKSPSALMLPLAVRELLKEQAAILAILAATIEKETP